MSLETVPGDCPWRVVRLGLLVVEQVTSAQQQCVSGSTFRIQPQQRMRRCRTRHGAWWRTSAVYCVGRQIKDAHSLGVECEVLSGRRLTDW